MLEPLRPKPFRGDQVAAGTVVLTILVLLLNTRFGTRWGDGVHLGYTAAAAALVLAMAVAAPAEPAGPPAWHATLYVSGFLLALVTLSDLAAVLGSGGLGRAGTATWVGALLTVLAAWFSRRRGSASATLLASVTGVVTSLAFVQWAFSPGGVGTFRYLLLADVAVLSLMALWQRIRGPAHGVQLLNAVGLALLGISATFAVSAVASLIAGLSRGAGGSGAGGFHVAWGWALLVLAGGVGILSAGAADRERGNVLIGIALLAAFVTMTRDGTLLGWPVVLAAAAAALLVIGLRPSTPLPSEPPPGVGPEPGRLPGAPAR